MENFEFTKIDLLNKSINQIVKANFKSCNIKEIGIKEFNQKVETSKLREKYFDEETETASYADLREKDGNVFLLVYITETDELNPCKLYKVTR